MKLNHILLTTDLSEDALRSFAPVLELAEDNGAKVTVLHVVADLRVAPHGSPLAPPISAADIGVTENNARVALAELTKDMKVESDVMSHPDVGRGVCDYATEHGVDMIALSTHGRTGLRRFVLGSVAEAVLRHSHVPVLAFPPAE